MENLKHILAEHPFTQGLEKRISMVTAGRLHAARLQLLNVYESGS